MKRYVPHARPWLAAILVLLLALSACDLNGGSSSTGTPPHPKNAQTTPSATSIQLGAQPCPDAVKAPAHWDGIVVPTSSQKVEGVICGYLMGVSSLQAVVKVRSAGNNQLLDIAVYTAITNARPSQIFSLKGLRYGEVSVSSYNTLLTMEIDLNARQGQIQHDLYREFKWSDSVGTLAQVPFVGLYPDMTRYQAEVAQGEVNTGHGSQPWRLSAVTTAQNFAEFELGWNPTAPTTVVSGSGTHDAQAVILVMNPSAGNATIKLSLSRLELNTNGGIWEVTGVATDGMTIASSQNAQQLTSPAQVTGSNTAFAGKPATIMILDQDHTQMSQALSASGRTQFSASVSYTSNFQGETEEGIIALYTYSGNQVIVGAAMVKVLLSA
jgi:hypothetical protein